MPPMQALRAFEAAATQQSLTRAAQTLNLTHGAVSHQIKSLEATLGVRLIERAGRGIRVTDAGERLATRVRAALAEIGDAVREAGERSNPRKFCVSVMPSFAARWLLPRLGRFLRENDDIDIDVRSSIALANFRHDDVDVAIRYGHGTWPDVKTEFLMGDAFFPVCSPRLSKRPVQPHDLAQHTLLRANDESWKPWFEAVGLSLSEPTRGPIFNDSALLLQACVEGQGIALARSSLIGHDIRNGLLMRLFDIDVPAPRSYFLVYPPRVAGASKLERFRDWLHREIAQENAERRGKRTRQPPRREQPKRRS